MSDFSVIGMEEINFVVNTQRIKFPSCAYFDICEHLPPYATDTARVSTASLLTFKKQVSDILAMQGYFSSQN